MFKTISTRIAQKAATALVITTIGLGLFTGAGAAHAQPIKLGDGTPCTDADGKSYPEGTLAKDRWGLTYVCISGKWEVSPQALTVDPPAKKPVVRAARATVAAP